MSDFITLTCPNCAGKLQITDDVERFACAFCGVEHIVRRSGGIVTLKPIVEGLEKVKIGVDKTASELAIARLTTETARIEDQIGELTTNYQRKFSELNLKYRARLPKRSRFAGMWPKGAAWVPIIGVITLIFLILANTARFVGDTVCVLSIMCLGPIIVLFAVFWYWQARRFNRWYQALIKEREAEIEAIQQDYNNNLAPLKQELEAKQQQLARHREIVSRFD